MKRHLRSTVGAAVVAGSLVFSGTAAHAQDLTADDETVAAPVEIAAPVTVEAAPVEKVQPAPETLPAVVVPPVNDGSDAGTTEPPAAEDKAPAGIVEPPPTETDAPAEDAATDSATELPADADANPSDEAPVPDEEAVSDDAAGLVADQATEAPGTEAPAIQAPALTPAPETSIATETKPKVTEKSKPETAKPAAASLPGADLLEFPEGSETWTEDQWWDWAGSGEGLTWMEDNDETLFYLTDVDDNGDFIDEGFSNFFDEVAPFFLNGDAAGLLAYLNEMYPEDPLRAQFMAGIVLGLLIDAGLIDEEGNPVAPPVTEPETEKPVEKPVPEPEEELVVKPVINVKPPKAPAEKPKAVIKPVKLPAPALVETGADGMAIAGGIGGGLLLLGIGAMALRRRKNA